MRDKINIKYNCPDCKAELLIGQYCNCLLLKMYNPIKGKE
jgi:hypothetical protein